jgi:exodeoxyribonuclease V alpha subunit
LNRNAIHNAEFADNVLRLAGIVERVTYHNTENGWSVLKVTPFGDAGKLATVVIHQAKVFAGSSMEFWGMWVNHPKHGEQFKAVHAVELKPSSSAAIEKYLGSGLIKGVGPKIAARIVKHFRERTLDVLENSMDELLLVPGIAQKKLVDIKDSWAEHRAIRDVMLFLQGHGISTLYAVKIYKSYGNNAIEFVSEDPYRLARDIHGIGFFSADKIALSMGFERDGERRVRAGIRHVLSAARDDGHCYLLEEQICLQTTELLEASDAQSVVRVLNDLLLENEIRMRELPAASFEGTHAYYAKSLYYAEAYVAKRVCEWARSHVLVNNSRVQDWVNRYCEKHELALSEEQRASVVGVAGKAFSILTGGPGCGKTTTTKAIVKLFLAMKKRVLLAAPTGRAAQRMSEVIGVESQTIHRLLEWMPAKAAFKKNENDTLAADVLIVDECSMLDVELAAALLKAVPPDAQVVFIGDPDQLPAVGAGNVLQDLLSAPNVASFRLTKIFRQAEESSIIRFAHQINRGEIPKVPSPIPSPELWENGEGCLFVDAEEASQEQLTFLRRAKAAIRHVVESGEEQILERGGELAGVLRGVDGELRVDDLPREDVEKLLVQEYKDKHELNAPVFVVPEKFKHVDLERLAKARGVVEELKTAIRSVHPWSALNYGFTGLDMVLRLYTKTIRKHYGGDLEIQVLSPQVRGSLGTANLNLELQKAVNPQREGVKQMTIGERIFREGDRVIQTRNNYDLGVFNGDIGAIAEIDLVELSCKIQFEKRDPVEYRKEDMLEISLAYAITIHKSQGSEFGAVIIPVTTQHFRMLFRNLIYTALTRGKKICIFVGNRKALALAVKQVDNRKRQTALTHLVSGQ